MSTIRVLLVVSQREFKYRYSYPSQVFIVVKICTVRVLVQLYRVQKNVVIPTDNYGTSHRRGLYGTVKLASVLMCKCWGAVTGRDKGRHSFGENDSNRLTDSSTSTSAQLKAELLQSKTRSFTLGPIRLGLSVSYQVCW